MASHRTKPSGAIKATQERTGLWHLHFSIQSRADFCRGRAKAQIILAWGGTTEVVLDTKQKPSRSLLFPF
jgi:hypothetical protein